MNGQVYRLGCASTRVRLHVHPLRALFVVLTVFCIGVAAALVEGRFQIRMPSVRIVS